MANYLNFPKRLKTGNWVTNLPNTRGRRAWKPMTNSLQEVQHFHDIKSLTHNIRLKMGKIACETRLSTMRTGTGYKYNRFRNKI